MDSVNVDMLLSPATHISIGVFLSVSGIIGIVANAVVLATLWRSLTSRLSPASIVLVNLTLSDIGILLMGFPFNATSHFAGRWLYGALGCQIYGFCCFLFGSAHIGALALLAYEQYRTISRMRPDAAPSERYLDRLQRTYVFYGVCIWMLACMWATPPLFGWSRYSLEPFGTACTIDWRHNTVEYKSYIVAYFIGGYLLPFTLIMHSFRRILQQKRAYRVESNRRSISSPHEAPTIIEALKKQREEDLVTTCLLIVASFLCTWTPYAILCLWSVFWGPSTIPTFLSIAPNICAKVSGAINPFIYSISNRNLRSGIVDTLRSIGAIRQLSGRSHAESGVLPMSRDADPSTQHTAAITHRDEALGQEDSGVAAGGENILLHSLAVSTITAPIERKYGNQGPVAVTDNGSRPMLAL